MLPNNVMILVGNLVDDPQLIDTRHGQVVRFRVASNPRYRNGAGEWQDGEPMYLNCYAWRQLATNTADSLHRGDGVVVAGRLTPRTYRGQTTLELECDDIAPSLRAATAVLTRTTRRTERPLSAVAS